MALPPPAGVCEFPQPIQEILRVACNFVYLKNTARNHYHVYYIPSWLLNKDVPVPTFFVNRKAANYSPIAAPFDLPTQAAHSIHLAKSGIKGLVVLGSTGEAVHLSNKERFEVLSGIRKELEKAGFKDYPIIAGTASQNIEEVVEQLKSAKEAGSQWGLCLVPGYFAGASTQEGIIEWFKAVADQSPIPVMV
jgi:2-keto-3-deoxy-L-rhamnonate aldolase